MSRTIDLLRDLLRLIRDERLEMKTSCRIETCDVFSSWDFEGGSNIGVILVRFKSRVLEEYSVGVVWI